ncbi:MAG TPA: HAD-IA family hydrolase [Blastocatellia bacterium]|nr:HAD-IA family hydrolase [Blastocatellia bacterium]
MISVSCMLFDLDGTLIDSSADLARAVNLMLADLGRTALDQPTVIDFVGDGVGVLVRRALTATDPDHAAPDDATHREALALMRKHYGRQMLVETRLYPGVRETLSHFAAKPKAIVTSKESGFARTLLEHLSIAQHFAHIVGGESLPQRKPDPAPVLEALHRIGHAPSAAVMIGDSENDVLAGRRAGARTCAVNYGFRGSEQLRAAAPDFEIDRFDRLAEIFR